MTTTTTGASSSAFAAATETGAAERFAQKVAQADCTPFALLITEGMHEGAFLRGRACMTVGASPQDDLMLRDPGVDPTHAEIARVNGSWALLSSNGTSTRALKPVESRRQGRFLRQRYTLGGASLVLTQLVGPDKPAVTVKRWSRPAVLWPAFLAALTLMVLAGWFVSHARDVPAVPPVRNLVAEGWPDVQLGPDLQGGLAMSGYVDDAVQLERLREWWLTQPLQAVHPVSWQVRTGSEVTAMVRKTLNAEEVAVSYIGAGRLRVQGTVSDASVRERLRHLTNDLAGTVQVEDHLAVIDAQASAPRMRPLPFRIMDVVPGPNGHFRTDTGGRYFVGATLQDGAEVIAISTDVIEFQIGDRQVLYPLK
ncbi:MAG: hypothetical protein V4739_13110 [Pseudomonadota bacterium]